MIDETTNTQRQGVLHIARRVPIWVDSVHTLCGRVLPLTRPQRFDGKLTRCPECAAAVERLWDDRAVVEHD